MTQSNFMSAPHVDEDRCLDLVQGLLNPAERRIALEHLQACAGCERRFREIAASHARALSAAATILPEQVPAQITKFRPRPWLLAAACIAAVLGVARFARQVPSESAFVSDLESHLPRAQLRGAIRDLQISAGDTTIAAGLNAYNRGEYAAARRYLETTIAGGRLETVRKVYLGSTLLELGEAVGAVRLLRDLDMKRIPEPWKSETQWNLALALERSGRVATADSIFALLSRERTPVGERARAYRASTLRPK